MPSRKALIVGVSQYAPETELSNLSAPVRDAQVVYEMLRQYGNFDLPPILLHEGQDKHGRWMEGVVNTDDLEKALDNLFTQEEAEAVDLAVFYFSGHGTYDNKTRQAFLATTDNAQAITLLNLLDRVENSHIQNVCIWLDACHSGGVLDFKELKGKNYCVVAAASKFGSALAPYGGNSFLTQLLCQALKPCETSRPEVTTFELVRYLKQHRRDLPPLQHVLFVHGEHYFPLTFCDHPLPESDRISPDECPFKGLEAFTQNDAKYFFGRKRIIQQYLDRLEQEGGKRLVPIIGASGSGKSSLVLAGIIPNLLETDWEVRIIQPASGCPLQNLQDILGIAVGGQHDAATVQQAVLQQIPEGKKFLLVIDQFEQVFTQCTDGIEKIVFKHLLSMAVQANSHFYLMLTLRWDFLEDFLQYANDVHPDMREYLRLIELLPTLDSDELYEAITEPLKLIGMTIDGGLVNELSAKSLGEKGSLPLLQYTLKELWTEVKRKGNSTLTWDLYQQLGEEHGGGLRGILNQKANEFYESLTEKQKLLLEWLMVSLTQHREDDGAYTRRTLTMKELTNDQLEYKDTIHALIERLASEDYRLLTKGSTPENMPTVTVAHEVLIRDWIQLGTWLQTNREIISWRERIKEDVIDWKRTGGSLLQDGRLAEAQELLARYPESLLIGNNDRDFIKSGIKHQKRQRNKFVISIALFIIVLLAGIAATTWQWQEAEKQQREASRQANNALVGKISSQSMFNSGIGNTDKKHINRGILMAVEAFNLDPQSLTAKKNLLDILYSTHLIKTLYWNEPINNIEINDKEKLIFSSGEHGSVQLWDEVSGKKSTSFWHGFIVGNGKKAISPDGNLMASSGYGGILELWNSKTGKLHSKFQQGNEIMCIRFSPDGKLIAAGDESGNIMLWDIATNKLLNKSFTGHSAKTNTIAFSSDGKKIISGSDDQTLRLWDVATGEIIGEPWHGHSGAVTSVAFLADSSLWVVSGSDDKSLILWDATAGKTIKSPWQGHTSGVTSVAVSHNGEWVVSGGQDNTLILWDNSGQAIGKPWLGHEGEGFNSGVSSVVFSSDDKYVFSGGRDGTLRKWSRNAGLAIGKHFDTLSSTLAFSPDNKYILSGFSHGLELWDIATAKCTSDLWVNETIRSVAFSPDGKQVVSAGEKGVLRLWDVTTGELIGNGKPWVGHDDDDYVYQVRFSPDGKKVISGSSDRSLMLWDVSSGMPIGKPWLAHQGTVEGVAFSPDGKQVVSGGWDGKLLLWDVNTGKQISEFWRDGNTAYISSVSFSPDGKLVISGGHDNALTLWSMETKKPIGFPWRGHNDTITSVTFSHNGKLVASTSDNKKDNIGEVILWDVETSTPIGEHRYKYGYFGQLKNNPPQDIAFSSDDKLLAASGPEGISIWEMEPSLWVKKACSIVNRNFDLIEWKLVISDTLPYQKTCPDLPAPSEAGWIKPYNNTF
ncbi:MAG: caspase family protein [Candidatus Thiothrix sulfatifontis]|nr:MAG: caspase family protein [Candidatus Thiothrix sulfatifontis]